jgi:hypothetical protein
MIWLLATVWNSILAWVVIGIAYLLVALLSGDWSWHSELLIFWPAVLFLGYVTLARAEWGS